MAFKMKGCQRCGQEYLPTNNYQKYCPDCRIITRKETNKISWAAYYVRHGMFHHGLSVKICTKCGQEYQPTACGQQFCVDCGSQEEIAKAVKWRAAHREERKVYADAHRVQTAARGVIYRAEHKEQRYVKIREWQKRNPEKWGLYLAKHRALKYANTPINELLTETQWLAILTEHNGHCHYCGKETKLTMDHVIPLSGGGKHSKDNVVPACRHCNSSKNDTAIEDWAGGVYALLSDK